MSHPDSFGRHPEDGLSEAEIHSGYFDPESVLADSEDISVSDSSVLSERTESVWEKLKSSGIGVFSVTDLGRELASGHPDQKESGDAVDDDDDDGDIILLPDSDIEIVEADPNSDPSNDDSDILELPSENAETMMSEEEDSDVDRNILPFPSSRLGTDDRGA